MCQDVKGKAWPAIEDHPCGCRVYRDAARDEKRSERCQSHTFLLIGELLSNLAVSQLRDVYGEDYRAEDYL